VLLTLSGVVGLVTTADWVPDVLLLQLPGLDVLSLGLHSLLVAVDPWVWSLYQVGMFNLANDLDTLIWWTVGSIGISGTRYFS